MQAIKYELKYCERCGSLQLRRADSAENYCPVCECALVLALSPDALVSKLRRKPRASRKRMLVPPGEAYSELSCGRSL